MRVRLLVGILLSLCTTVVIAQWRLLPGLATDIGVGARGEAWVTGIDQVEGGHSIYRWDGSDWQIVPGGALRIDVDPQGTPWVVNNAGQIFAPGAGGWQQMPGLARDIGVGANGSVWVIGVTPIDRRVHGASLEWTRLGPGARRCGQHRRRSARQPWVVNDRGDIFRRTPTGQWQASTRQRDGRDDCSGRHCVGARQRLASRAAISIQRWTGKRWRRINGGGVALSAGRDAMARQLRQSDLSLERETLTRCENRRMPDQTDIPTLRRLLQTTGE